MIAPHFYPLVGKLWPDFKRAARAHSVDEWLLFSMCWVLTGLGTAEACLPEEVGTWSFLHFDEPRPHEIGIMAMHPDVADTVAMRLGVARYDLADPQTAIDFAAAHLNRLTDWFGLPRLAVAAYVVGAESVAGGMPYDIVLGRMVRDVMAVWSWSRENLDDVIACARRFPIPHDVEHHTVTGAMKSCTVLPAMETASSGEGKTTVLSASWRVYGFADARHAPLCLNAGAVSTIEALAVSLKLAYARDDDQQVLYLGLPRIQDEKRTAGRLISPVPGACAENAPHYTGIQGLEIITSYGTPVVAVGAGRLLGSEEPGTVILQLDKPINYHGRPHAFCFYSALSRRRYQVLPDVIGPWVDQGTLLGWTGCPQRVPLLQFELRPHLHCSNTMPSAATASCFGWTGR